MAVNLMDKAYQTELEQEIDTLQQKMFGSYYEVVEELAEVKKPKPKHILINKPINEVRGKGHGTEKERKELLKQKRLQQAIAKA